MGELSPLFSGLKSFAGRIQVSSFADPHCDELENARQLRAGLNAMEPLTHLSLEFATTESRVAAGSDTDIALFFKEMVKNLRLPSLTTMEFTDLSCYVGDLTRFVINHGSVIKSCRLRYVTSEDEDGLSQFTALLERLRDSCDLEMLDMYDLELENGYPTYTTLSFPNVQGNTDTEFHGLQEVQQGLDQMLSSIVPVTD